MVPLVGVVGAGLEPEQVMGVGAMEGGKCTERGVTGEGPGERLMPASCSLEGPGNRVGGAIVMGDGRSVIRLVHSPCGVNGEGRE